MGSGRAPIGRYLCLPARRHDGHASTTGTACRIYLSSIPAVSPTEW
jgi:hypothetical protein